MSPGMKVFTMVMDGFPRVSGDEPWVSATDAIPAAFSPRERG